MRGTITSEMWETTNDTWLKMREYPRWKLAGSEIGEFFEWVKFRSHLSRGVTVGTMPSLLTPTLLPRAATMRPTIR